MRLAVAAPLAFLGGIASAARQGIVVKGGNFLESLVKADTFIFDKTGTLTKAEPTVLDIVSFNGMKCKELLRIAACLEEHFPHSMAKAVVQAAVDRNLVHEELHSEVEYIVAHGISSMIENKKLSLEVIILYSKMSSVQFLKAKKSYLRNCLKNVRIYIWRSKENLQV